MIRQIMLSRDVPPHTLEQIVSGYLEAKRRVIAQGFGHSLDWQSKRRLDLLTEQEFLREAAWVVLSAGISEMVVRRCFGELSRCFMYWESADAIRRNRTRCVRKAQSVFGHRRKINAIAEIACSVARTGFAALRQAMNNDGLSVLRRFPYIGPVTVYHLAKNLGFDVAKPDRHLVRITAATGMREPQDLCSAISAVVGDRIAVVDLVLWRFAVTDKGYLQHFSSRHCG